MKLLKLFIITVLSALTFATYASATLLDGQTVTVQYLFPTQTTPYNPSQIFVAPDTVPVNLDFGPGGVFNLAVSDTNLLATFNVSAQWSPADFNGFMLSAPNVTFTSVDINEITNLPGFTASNISFDAHNIWVNWQGIAFDTLEMVSLDLNGHGTTPVPEPGTVILLGVGMAGLAIYGKRRKSNKA